MALFGKEININIDKKQIKLLILIGAILIVVTSLYVLVFLSIEKFYDKKDELKEVKIEKIKIEQDIKLLEKRNIMREEEKRNQRERLNTLLNDFEKHSFKNEAKLKQMVQEILDHLDIELLEIGKTEIALIEGKEEYKRKMVPYRISGEGRNIALFFYYLENSKTLLTLKNSRLEVSSKNFEIEDETKIDAKEKNRKIEVKFKLGFYTILYDKTQEDEVGEDNEG